MPIKTRKSKKRKKNVKIDTQKYVYQGSPPYYAYKKPTKKTQGKIDPQKYVYQGKKKRENRPSEIRLSGVTPIMPINPTKKKEKNVKIDPQKYVYQKSPL